ncbi:MAG TPA: transketolase [Polyangia bacterium]|nr:transketolase [Polyangia bacterium]
MRKVLATTLVGLSKDKDFAFLTGDLGFMALEPLREAAGERFINAGVAEQNMVSVAAGMARLGFRPWVYSIAPFVYARAFEQIRNDVCFHKLPVCLIGNGGGYAYGVMGATHHALEDYGALLGLPHMTVYVPAFAADVPVAAERIARAGGPAYFRLGRDELPKNAVLPAYAPWRRLLTGGGPTLVVVGPLAGGILGAAMQVRDPIRPSLWVLSELPVLADEIPAALIEDIKRSGHLIVVEEHVAPGGAGQGLAHALLSRGAAPSRFSHRHAQGYPSGFYGSQDFHRKECGLDPQSILASIEKA